MAPGRVHRTLLHRHAIGEEIERDRSSVFTAAGSRQLPQVAVRDRRSGRRVRARACTVKRGASRTSKLTANNSRVESRQGQATMAREKMVVALGGSYKLAARDRSYQLGQIKSLLPIGRNKPRVHGGKLLHIRMFSDRERNDVFTALKNGMKPKFHRAAKPKGSANSGGGCAGSQVSAPTRGVQTSAQGVCGGLNVGTWERREPPVAQGRPRARRGCRHAKKVLLWQMAG
ncbi:hypothetical protein K438DRAFT_1777195 [Mycena galopus ATCC 62051]|nr:hypothetical protein K438DRAFT_1777195 [Mycena galopus ATCC 62051]